MRTAVFVMVLLTFGIQLSMASSVPMTFSSKLRRRLHPGHGPGSEGKSDWSAPKDGGKGGNDEPMSDEVAGKWEAAFKLKEEHLRLQRIFHTSELERYTNRDKMIAAQRAAWDSDDKFQDRCRAVSTVWRESKKTEHNLNKGITKNQRARNGPQKQAQEAFKGLKRVRKLEGGEGEAVATEEQIGAAFEKYLEQARLANEAEQAFHHIEFKEFDGQQKCIDDARAAIAADPKPAHRAMVSSFFACMRTVQEDIKRAMVNKANRNRVDVRHDVPSLWMDFLKKFRSWHQNEVAKRKAARAAKKAAKKAGNGGNRPPRSRNDQGRALMNKMSKAIRELKAEVKKFCDGK